MSSPYSNLLSKLRLYYCKRYYRCSTQSSSFSFSFATCTTNGALRPHSQNIDKQGSQQQMLRKHECFKSEKADSLSGKYQCWVRLFQSTTSCLSVNGDSKPGEISEAEYEAYVEETLDSLTDFFEDLPECGSCSKDYDCSYSNGVLTIQIGGLEGTYVINKQTPNKQIWLSSPVSGPKRYDYLDGQWVYLRDGKGLHRLLEEEISKLIEIKIDLKKCRYYSWGTSDRK